MIATPARMIANVAEHLQDDEIHVWRLDYRRQDGRAPLLRVLGAYLGTDPDGIALTEGEHGRPALAPPHDQSLGFNWSHSGHQAVIAIGRRITPGIDLEQRRARPRALDIAQHYFSADETAALVALPAAERDVAFLELWTAKEAVLKALGRGIAFGLHRLSIAIHPQQLSLERLEGDDVRAWQLQRLAIDSTLIAALAWRGDPRRVRHEVLASDA
ncbi:4'-phosphopantetheinyl transferase family protein [Rhodanobacter sp. Col0626]|uniref:4'-phosphopantetheinyl transferase family protein n=1 Tax=Rhodanobacter sp. Col0626 TaxID=3415679 RepID=UPI003CF5EA42